MYVFDTKGKLLDKNSGKYYRCSQTFFVNEKKKKKWTN